MTGLIAAIVALIAGLLGWGALERRRANVSAREAVEAKSHRVIAETSQRRSEREKQRTLRLVTETRRVQETTRQRLDTLRSGPLSPEEDAAVTAELEEVEERLKELEL